MLPLRRRNEVRVMGRGSAVAVAGSLPRDAGAAAQFEREKGERVGSEGGGPDEGFETVRGFGDFAPNFLTWSALAPRPLLYASLGVLVMWRGFGHPWNHISNT